MDLDLLQIVKSYFAAIGINMQINVMDQASWHTFVITNHQHDQMAARGVGSLGYTCDPMRQLRRFTTGYNLDYLMVSDPVYDAFYTNAMAAASTDATKQIVRDANEYVARQHFAISLLAPQTYALCQPWLKGYRGQNSSISNSVSSLLGFYTSRFFIDQDLKHSLGHWDAPTVTNSTGASNIAATAARLNGEITKNGGENPTVHIYWGPTDGGTTPGNWAHDINLGIKPAGTFYADISGLNNNTTYYYSCNATNSAGSSWAGTAFFSTFSYATAHGKLIGVDDSNPSSGTYPGNDFFLYRFLAVDSGNITSFKIKTSGSGNVKVAVYADNAGAPGTLLNAVNTSTPVVAGWNDIIIPPTGVVSGTSYWLAYASDAAIGYYQSAAGTLKYKSVTYSSFTFPGNAGTDFTTLTTSVGLLAGWGVKPQYGGTINIRSAVNVATFDPYFGPTTNINSGWMERLTTDNWTLNPAVWDYKTIFRPSEYVTGQLASSWEFTDPSTLVVHLRPGIHWQNIAPVNGREFTAADVVYHYDRLKTSSYWSALPIGQNLSSLVAVDPYTVVFHWSVSCPEFVMDTVLQPTSDYPLEAPEVVQQYGNTSDWHHAIGTGPFILTDFVDGSSATMVRNPNYWGHDECNPQNQLPYADSVKYLIIPDQHTALAALRTGKIDAMDGVSYQDTQAILNKNPEILQFAIPAGTTLTIDPRNDRAPFTDIRVRKAMQMAIDLPTIASSYYGGSVSSPNPSTLTGMELAGAGWGWPYDQWPQDLKDQYAYNPTAALNLLTQAGYPNGFSTNIYVPSIMDLNLVQITKSYFAAIGINMQINVMDIASWTTYVKGNHQHDQMAASASGSLGLTNAPTPQLARFTTGFSFNWLMVSDPVYDAFYTNAMAATSVGPVKQIVRDANEYVARQHFAISLLAPQTYALRQPWLKGYNGQNGSISYTTPNLLGFYTSRFGLALSQKRSP